MPSTNRKKRILFVGEAVTLAHVARPMVLAESLNPDEYDVCLACDPRYNSLIGSPKFELRYIKSISSSRFFGSLSTGKVVYDVDTLRSYVQEDLNLIEEFRPDVVVGDFRISLAASARKAAVPFITVTNAYWSPYAKLKFVVPDLEIIKKTGVFFGQQLFNVLRHRSFWLHAQPFNAILREYGVPPFRNLLEAHTTGDFTFYADLPEIVPCSGLPSSHHFIGPILWSPKIPFPTWWKDLPKDQPIVYVTVGSSGQSQSLAVILQGLSTLDVTVIVATAGRSEKLPLSKQIFIADFLPGDEAAAISDLVICNGGSPTSYQALAAGVSVLGIPSNLDQYLNMSLIEKSRSGLMLRSGSLKAEAVKSAVQRILSNPEFRSQAGKLKHSIAQFSATEKFQTLLKQIVK